MIGETLSHFEIIDKLGEGGMGVVYKARDTKLNRLVALKVLPADRLANAERKKRFVQEAQSASALNHPNIVTIYEIADENGVDFIAMEYVAGKTLDELIPRKGMRLGEALKIAVQVADALSAAHEAGIIHRDIKPGNIILGDGGRVRVLDFGLAKLTEVDQESDDAETRTVVAGEAPRTEEGTILGTASYMSPEQAQGLAIDARSDVFSFGSVLYEMLTGRRPFEGDSSMSALAAIIKEEPKPVRELAEELPGEAERIVKRCLRKDVERRFQLMKDLRVELEDLKEESDSGRLIAPVVGGQRSSSRTSIRVAGVILTSAALLAAGWFWSARKAAVLDTEPLTAAPFTSYAGNELFPSFSPDGNQVAFAWNEGERDNFDIYIRMIGTEKPLRLTNHPAQDFSPTWSPDGRSVAFCRVLEQGGSAVYLIPPLGGPERRLADVPLYCGWRDRAIAWHPGGEFLAISGWNSAEQVPAVYLLSIGTGETRTLTQPSAEEVLADQSPAFSPDGSKLVFVRYRTAWTSDLYLLSLSEGLEPIGEPERLTFDDGQWTNGPMWTSDGRGIIFSSGTRYTRRLWKTSASGSGKPQRLAFIGEQGTAPAISPEGSRLAYVRSSTKADVLRVDLRARRENPDPPTKLISTTQWDGDAAYSPGGQTIAFMSNRSGSPEIWVCDEEGTDAVQLTSFGGQDTSAPQWSPGGESIVFVSRPQGSGDIYIINSEGGIPRRLTTNPSNDVAPSWSRSGEWVYFASNRSGTAEVWKIPADGGEAVQITRNTGHAPMESVDGRYVYFAKRPPGPDSLWRIPTSGGEESQVLDSLVYHLSYTVADHGIYYLSASEEGKPIALKFFKLDSGKTSQIIEFEETPYSRLSLSPDARFLVYTLRYPSNDDLMLVENFQQ